MTLTPQEQVWLNKLDDFEDDPSAAGPGVSIRVLARMYRNINDLQDRVDFLEAEVAWIRFHADKGRVILHLTPSGVEG